MSINVVSSAPCARDRSSEEFRFLVCVHACRIEDDLATNSRNKSISFLIRSPLHSLRDHLALAPAISFLSPLIFLFFSLSLIFIQLCHLPLLRFFSSLSLSLCAPLFALVIRKILALRVRPSFSSWRSLSPSHFRAAILRSPSPRFLILPLPPSAIRRVG